MKPRRSRGVRLAAALLTVTAGALPMLATAPLQIDLADQIAGLAPLDRQHEPVALLLQGRGGHFLAQERP